MMYWGTGDWNWAAWLAMTVSMVAFWGLIASAIISLARRPTHHGPTAEQILDERFARGDIDDDEYRRRRGARARRRDRARAVRRAAGTPAWKVSRAS